MKKFIKIVLIVVGSIVGLIFALGAITTISALFSSSSTEVEQSSSNPITEDVKSEKKWSEMTYEERDSIMNLAIGNREFTNVSDIEYQMREAIKREARNPRTVTFTLSPSIYNGTANVVEADSAWIHTSYKGYAKNDFGVEKEFTGFVMYRYKSETKSLDVSHWDISFSE